MSMSIKPVSHEFIAFCDENYHETEFANVIVNPNNNTVIIVDEEIAYLITIS